MKNSNVFLSALDYIIWLYGAMGLSTTKLHSINELKRWSEVMRLLSWSQNSSFSGFVEFRGRNEAENGRGTGSGKRSGNGSGSGSGFLSARRCPAQTGGREPGSSLFAAEVPHLFQRLKKWEKNIGSRRGKGKRPEPEWVGKKWLAWQRRRKGGLARRGQPCLGG